MSLGPQVISENAESITLNMTAELADALHARKIFLRPPGYDAYDKIIIAKNAVFGGYAHFPGCNYLYSNGSFSYSETSHANINLKVGRYSSIAEGFKLFGERHPSEWAVQSNFTYNAGYPAVAAGRADLMQTRFQDLHVSNIGYVGANIGNDVWIGQNVQMAQGVTVGDGAIIAAGSVVTKDVKSHTVVAGVPAKTIKKRFMDEIIMMLQSGRWWDVHPGQVFNLPIKQPYDFAKQILALRENEKIVPYSPIISTWLDLVRKKTT